MNRTCARFISIAAAIALWAGLIVPIGAIFTPTPAAASPVGTMTMYPDNGINGPEGITTGSDGNMWFTNTVGNSIGRITPTGHASYFRSAGIAGPFAIAAGPDGNVWFTNLNSSIGRITPDGVVTNFVGAGIAHPLGIAAGPDGNLWFTNNGNDSIGRITTAGVVSNFTSSEISAPHGITAGPDGNLWFTNLGIGSTPGVLSIAKMTTAGVLTTYTGTGISSPLAIAGGPDGNVWFTNYGDDGSIGRITPAGDVTTFEALSGPPISSPRGITAGPDGNLWFTSNGNGAVGRVTPTGPTITFATGTDGPHGITAGPDGNLWFTNRESNSISRVTVDGSTTTFPATAIDRPHGIAAGADGNLWFTNSANNSIGRITTDGVVSNFAGGALATPTGITAGPDGNLWFTGWGSNTIGRITPAGVITNFGDPSIALPNAIATGADGNLWFTNWGNDTIGRITPDGSTSAFSDPSVNDPAAITAGPDGNLWFTNHGSKTIGRITPDGTITNVSGAEITDPIGIAAGPYDDVWFANADSSRIGRIDASGVITSFPATGMTQLRDLVTGPDGNLWFTSDGAIGRMTPEGELTSFDVAEPEAQPIGIAAGPDGGVWFTESTHGGIGRITAVEVPDPSPATSFHPVRPTRILDSRGPIGGWSGPLAAGVPRSLTVTGGTAAVPDGVEAVVLNVTATGSSTDSYLTVFPHGSSPPDVSNLNVAAGQTIPNLVTVAVIDGQVDFATAAGSVDVIADLAGYYDTAPADRYNPTEPTRILDSRGPTGNWNAPLAAGPARTLQVTGGSSPVPATAHAVILNLTVTGATADSFLTAFPAGTFKPVASNLNFAAGQTTSNLATVKIGSSGQIAFATAKGAVHVIADVAGYYDTATGDLFHPLPPTRLLDSRRPTGPWGTPLAARPPRTLRVNGRSRVPAAATAVIANTTVTGGTANSFLTVFPGATPPPTASNVNYAAGQTVPNLVAVKLGATGDVAFTTSAGTTHVVFDLAGYFAPA